MWPNINRVSFGKNMLTKMEITSLNSRFCPSSLQSQKLTLTSHLTGNSAATWGSLRKFNLSRTQHYVKIKIMKGWQVHRGSSRKGQWKHWGGNITKSTNGEWSSVIKYKLSYSFHLHLFSNGSSSSSFGTIPFSVWTNSRCLFFSISAYHFFLSCLG